MPKAHRGAVCTGPASNGSAGARARTASAALTVDSAQQGNACIVKLRGELDLATAPPAEAEILAALMNGYRLVVVDMGELTFIDSTGISTLLRLEARSRPDPGRLVFRRGTAAVQRVLGLCGVDGHLTFLD
jgi:anti-sigma B factor antagonist